MAHYHHWDEVDHDEFNFSDDSCQTISRPVTEGEWIRENMESLVATFHAMKDYLNTFGMPHILARLTFDQFAAFCFSHSA
jgi:hypothetical protein